jgi:hypothetical protein
MQAHLSQIIVPQLRDVNQTLWRRNQLIVVRNGVTSGS